MNRSQLELFEEAEAMGQKTFTSAEQREVATTGSHGPYLRTDDPFCRAFLKHGRDPRQFEGVKLLFPFVRTGSVYGMPRSIGNLHNWMAFAFFAGYHFGCAHPEHLEAVLPQDEQQDGVRRVGVLQKALADQRLSTGNAQAGFERIVESNREHYEGHSIHDVLAVLTLRSLRTGFAAATVAQTDPLLSDFLADLSEVTADRSRSVMTRHWIKAPTRAHGRSVVDQLDHPLVSMTRELHWNRPAELLCMMQVIVQALRAQEFPSEDRRAGSPYDLIAWIESAIRHGERVQRESPETVEQILAHYPEEKSKRILKMVRDVVRDARGADAARLLGPLMIWQQEVYGWSMAECQGERFGQIVYLVDFAIWIPWALARAPRRTARKRTPTPGTEGSEKAQAGSDEREQ